MARNIALGALAAALAASASLVLAVPAQAGAALRHEGLRAGYQFPVPAIGLVKSASVQNYSKAGTKITYSYDVTDTGDVTLAPVTVTTR